MSSYGNRIYIKGIEYDANNEGIDASTQALIMVDYEHHEIHGGSHYFIKDVVDLALNNVIDIQFTTPDVTKWNHLTFSITCESETEWFIYEGASIVAAGTTLPAINNNRNSLNTTQNTVDLQDNTSLANANADTDVSGATELAHGIVGSGKDGGTNGRSEEIITKQNTIYCFRAIANSAGFVDVSLEWYEHTNKN